MRLWIDAATVGTHAATVEVTGAEPVDRVVVVPTMVEMGHAARPVTATEQTLGRYQAVGVDLFMSGRWDVEVVLTGPSGSESVVFPVNVQP